MISDRELADRGIVFSTGVLNQIQQKTQEAFLDKPKPKESKLVETHSVTLPPLPIDISGVDREGFSSGPVVVVDGEDEDDDQELIPLCHSSQVSEFLLTPVQTKKRTLCVPATPSSSASTGSAKIATSTIESSKSIYGFNLEQALLSNRDTREIITQKLQDGRFVLRSDRQAIAAVLVDHVIENLGTSPSKAALEQLAKHLVKKYPTLGDPRRSDHGWQMWFFHAVKGLSATGFLEDRLKNQRKKLSKIKDAEKEVLVDVEELNWISENEDDNPEPDESQLEFLRQNFGSAIANTMKATVFMRRTLLRGYRASEFFGLQRAMQTMPRLFYTENMVIQDFNVRHPSVALILYHRWPKVAKLLLEYADESGINYKKKLEIAKSRYHFTDDDTGIVAYCLLPYILPSCGRKVADSESDDEKEESSTRDKGKRKRTTRPASRKKQCTVKASDLDSLRSMIQFRSKNTHVSEVLAENRRRAPFILALGSSANWEFETFFVVIYKVAIPCGLKFLVALDTCLKCFSVLYLPLLIESYDHWLFIQHGVCGKPFKETELPPVVQALIGQIMCRI